MYTGKVLPSGRIDGETRDKNNSKICETWHSEGVLKCPPPPVKASVATEPTPPRPKPLKSTGKMPKSEPAPPMKVPGIVVSPFIFPSPGSPTVFVVITWDAGPDHPYAEVWFKVNNGEGTFLVEQGKGGRQIAVERGKLYEYILTDAGKTLSTVTFAVPRR